MKIVYRAHHVVHTVQFGSYGCVTLHFKIIISIKRIVKNFAFDSTKKNYNLILVCKKNRFME